MLPVGDAGKIVESLDECAIKVLAARFVLDNQLAFPEGVDAAALGAELLTGSSKLATRRRGTPNTAKNSFQKVCDSARSLSASCHSRAKAIALSRISGQEGHAAWCLVLGAASTIARGHAFRTGEED